MIPRLEAIPAQVACNQAFHHGLAEGASDADNNIAILWPLAVGLLGRDLKATFVDAQHRIVSIEVMLHSHTRL